MKTSLEFDTEKSTEDLIKELIEKLEKEIKEEGLALDVEDDFEKETLKKRTVIPNGLLHYERPLKSSKKSMSRFILFVKRMIQSCNRFLIVPILEEQSAFNASIKSEIDRLNEMIHLQDCKIRKLEKSRKELSK